MADSSADLPSSITAPQWRQIVNSASETAIISTDPRGFVTSWSAGAERILGWSESDMIGRTLECIFTEEDRTRRQLAREIESAIAHGRGGGEEGWRLRKDNSRFWAAGEITPIRDADGRIVGFTKILRDRTAQRVAEEAIEEERRALRILNRAASALASEADLQRVVQIVTDAGVELIRAEFGAFFYNVTDSAGGSYMLSSLSGAPREAFDRFSMPRNTPLFAPTFSGEGVVRSDDVTLDPRYGQNGTGMPAGHLPVRSYLAVPVISRSGQVLGGLFFGHHAAGVFTARSEQNLAGLAGEAAVAIDNAFLAQANQRELAERTRAEEALQRLNASLEEQVVERTEALRRNEEALRQAQKMEALGQLTGGVAHDFNNLLQVITGNLDTLRRALPAPEEPRLARAVEFAMSGAKRAASLTQRLLAFSRRQPLNPKPIDVNALVGAMSDLLHRTLGETIAVEFVQGVGLWRVEVDPNELESAVINLAVNARDAMPEGGRLTIETVNSHVDEAYTARHAELIPGQYVVLSMSDSGVGMDAATLARAFEPFFTTKPVGKGTGLGLSQVYGFVKQSGGHVNIYSEPMQGTTIRIYLPRFTGQRDDQAPTVWEEHPPEGSTQETILVIEDDDDVRTYTVEVLRELGYRVIEAHDGPSGLRLLERQPRVDLLFTDVVLPGGLTGAQVVAEARGLSPSIKVLFTTGYARNAIIHHGRLDPGVQLITKPFGRAQLAGKIRDVLDGLA